MVSMSGNTALARVAKTKSAVLIFDVALDVAYRDDPQRQRFVTLTCASTLITVPMIKDDALIGAINVYRREVRPFTDKQVELLKNFAAQAVIAIENARLLGDLEKLNQQLERRVAEQVVEIERMSRLRRFLPPPVADLIVASGSEELLESHRREITALFCDLRGFTGFSESSDPEDVLAYCAITMQQSARSSSNTAGRSNGTLATALWWSSMILCP
jgi:GAF domain-containing protein